MSEIHLQVLAGLSNRLRSLVSGICLAEDYNCNLVVHWSLDHACGALFEQLFDPSTLPPFVTITPFPLLKAYHILSENDTEMIKTKWDRKHPLVVKSYAHFYTEDMSRWLTHLRKIQPRKEILDEVSQRLPPFDPTRFLGVHIRRTDHVKCIAASPLEAFLQKLDNTESFLIAATDDVGVRRELEMRYQGRIFFASHVLERFSEIGMREALIDFLCLSRCPFILGSTHSSYSEMAGLYGGCTVEFVKG
jgi:hypothetical protein